MAPRVKFDLEKILDECFEAGIQEVIFEFQRKKNYNKEIFLRYLRLNTV